jgi:uncharacterized membrane protein YtjA (UPF0391 family)
MHLAGLILAIAHRGRWHGTQTGLFRRKSWASQGTGTFQAMGVTTLRSPPQEKEGLFSVAAFFLYLSLLAAALGFSGLAFGAAGVARFLFIAFLVIAVVAFAVGGRQRKDSGSAKPLQLQDSQDPVRYLGRDLRPPDRM